MDVSGLKNRYARVVLALLASAGVFLLSLYTRGFTEHNVFPFLFAAVVLSAWLGGRLAALLSTAALSLATAYYHMAPVGFEVSDPDDVVRLGTFTLTGAFVAWLSGALKDSQTILMATLRSIGDAVIATDRRGHIRFFNPVAEKLTGWSHQDAKGRALTEVFRTVNAETGESVHLPRLETLQNISTLPQNTCLIPKSGDPVFIDDSIAPVQSESGKTLGSILVFNDASSRRANAAALREAERQLAQAQRMEAVGRLAGGIAHEFNNMLMVINGYAALVLEEIDDGSPLRSGVQEILKAGDRAATLTRQLLAFAHGQPVKFEVVDLNRIVLDFEKTLRRLISGIEIVTTLSEEPLYALVDVGQIEQVIMNLALNARDAMPGGGRLTIATAAGASDVSGAAPDSGNAATGCAVLRVSDTGVGIDPETRAHVFEPFFTTKETGKGTGLGLSIVHGIVAKHQGHIRVKSEPGQGSTFEVCLRRADPVPQESPVSLNPQKAPRGTATILLVEDNDDVRKLVKEILTNLGYHVLDAANAEDALLALENHRGKIDLMVTDIMMPGLSGLELAKRVSSMHPAMRVLFVSGLVDHDTAADALGEPNVAYLKKPITPADLASKVAEIVSRSRAADAG
jgi:PAS domain S-box-containing protein